MELPFLLADLEEFVTLHRPHGVLTSEAVKPTLKGYQLEVRCPCGVVFERWITPYDVATAVSVLARSH